MRIWLRTSATPLSRLTPFNSNRKVSRRTRQQIASGFMFLDSWLLSGCMSSHFGKVMVVVGKQFCIFACCGLVGNPHLTAKCLILLAFQRQPKKCACSIQPVNRWPFCVGQWARPRTGGPSHSPLAFSASGLGRGTLLITRILHIGYFRLKGD